ncbi:MAG: alpha/beta hydrolase [Betaproteobacteria bacterium]|nr:alpha/beta hydrolase [Betaproteobacteria bacterium]
MLNGDYPMDSVQKTSAQFVARATPVPCAETASLLARMNAAGASSLARKTPQEARDWLNRLVREETLDHPPALAAIENTTIPANGTDLNVRFYRPRPIAEGPLPLLVYFHAGGYVLGDLETLDSFCRVMAHHAECIVMSVEYRLAPENRFPVPTEDCYAATLWASENAPSIGADAARIAVGGDSSGGTLAIITSYLAQQRGKPEICHQFLWYPGVGSSGPTESSEKFSKGYFLEQDLLVWSMQNYLNSKEDMLDPRVQPLRMSDLSRMPPTFLMTAGFDARRDDNAIYAQRLRDAGVSVVFECVECTIHGFLFMLKSISAARDAAMRSAAHARGVFSSLTVSQTQTQIY